MAIVQRFFQAPPQSFFLFGPRGTGKSTWTRLHYPDAARIDLLDPDVFRTFNARPERLRELVAAQSQRRVFVIDEVQRAPELLTVVHALIEEKRDRQFVLTGSSARKIRRAGVDLLAGRALLRTLHPFMAAELGSAFALDRALEHGMLPLVCDSPTPADVLSSYAALYVREEVQTEGLVRNIGDFARFLEAISFSHGGVLNVSNVARECEAGRKAVEGYLGILADLLLAFRVPVFTKRAQRATAARDKLFLFDAGVFRSLRPSGPLDRPEEIQGAALEGLVAQHLRAWLAYRGERSKLYYWRTRAGVEVDFVVYGPDGFWAIEVKNTARINSRHLRPLRSFLDDYPECRALFLYRGAERLKQHDILCVPCEEFLCQLHPSRCIDAGF